MQVRAILNRLADGHREPRHSGRGRFWNLSRDEFVDAMIYGHKAITPRDPANSFLAQILRGPVSGFARMPPGGPYITAEDLAFIEGWIADGAPDIDSQAAREYSA